MTSQNFACKNNKTEEKDFDPKLATEVISVHPTLKIFQEGMHPSTLLYKQLALPTQLPVIPDPPPPIKKSTYNYGMYL